MGYLYDSLEKVLSKRSKNKTWSPNAVRALYLHEDAFVVEYHPIKGVPRYDVENLNPKKVQEDMTKGTLKSPLRYLSKLSFFMLEEVYLSKNLIKEQHEYQLLMVQGGFSQPDCRLRTYAYLTMPQGWSGRVGQLFSHPSMEDPKRPVAMLFRAVSGSNAMPVWQGKPNFAEVIHLSPVHYEADKEDGAVEAYFESIKPTQAQEHDEELLKLNKALVKNDSERVDEIQSVFRKSVDLKTTGFEVAVESLLGVKELFIFKAVGLTSAVNSDSGVGKAVRGKLAVYSELGKEYDDEDKQILAKLVNQEGKGHGYLTGALSHRVDELKALEGYVRGSKLTGIAEPTKDSLKLLNMALELATVNARLINSMSGKISAGLKVDEETKTAIQKTMGRPRSFTDAHEFVEEFYTALEGALPGIGESLGEGAMSGVRKASNSAELGKAFDSLLAAVNRESGNFSKESDWPEIKKILESEDMDFLIRFYDDVASDGDSRLVNYLGYYIFRKKTMSELSSKGMKSLPDKVQQFIKDSGYYRDGAEVVTWEQVKAEPKLIPLLSPKYVFETVIQDNAHRIASKKEDRNIPEMYTVREMDLFARKFLNIRIR